MKSQLPLLRGRLLQYHQAGKSIEPCMLGFGIDLAINMADSHERVLAYCDIHKGCYSFYRVMVGYFSHFSFQSISFDKFEQLIHPNDQKHFRKALHLSHCYIEKVYDDVLCHLMIAFECRLKLDANGYQRTMLKYRFSDCGCNGYHPILTLDLLRIGYGCKDVAPRGVYVINRKQRQIVYRSCHDTLTQREVEVLSLIVKGYSSTEIAPMLYISVNTVRAHRRNILVKVGCSGEVQATLYASMLEVMNI